MEVCHCSLPGLSLQIWCAKQQEGQERLREQEGQPQDVTVASP